MRHFFRSLLAGSCALGLAQVALAIQLGGGVNAPAALAPTPPLATIERGGTVNAVDWRMKTIVVDNVSYPLSHTPVVVHAPANQRPVKPFELKPGMQIRFSSSKQNFSAQDQVNEIWVTDARLPTATNKP